MDTSSSLYSEPLSHLPPEILNNILSHIPISDLASFAQTSKFSFHLALSALTNLQVSVLPRRVHGILAFLNTSTWDPDQTNYHYDFDVDGNMSQINFPTASLTSSASSDPSFLPQIPLTTNNETSSEQARRYRRYANIPPPKVYRQQIIETQNASAANILSSSILRNLQSLTLHLYELVSPRLASVIATHFHNLQELHLNLSHPYIHDSCLPSGYFRTVPNGSTVWNTLSGLGTNFEMPNLRSLKSITIERAGITSAQLQRWVEVNPNLSCLKLKNVTGVDLEFVTWLGKMYGSSSRTTSPQKRARLDDRRFCVVPESAMTNTPAILSRRRILKTLYLENCPNLKVSTTDEFEAFLPHLLSDLNRLSFNASQNVNSSVLLEFLEECKSRNITNEDEKLMLITPDHREKSRRVRNGHRRAGTQPNTLFAATSGVSGGVAEMCTLELSPSLSADDAPSSSSSTKPSRLPTSRDFLSSLIGLSSSLSPSYSNHHQSGWMLSDETSLAGSISAPTSMPSTPEQELDECLAMNLRQNESHGSVGQGLVVEVDPAWM